MPLCSEFSLPFLIDAIIRITVLSTLIIVESEPVVHCIGHVFQDHILVFFWDCLGPDGPCLGAGNCLAPTLWVCQFGGLWPVTSAARVLPAQTGSCSESREARRLQAGFPSGQGWGGGARAGPRREEGASLRGRPRIVIQ